MTMGLACDRDGYDLRVKQCSQCGSRGCPTRDHCKTIPPQPLPWRIPNRLKGTTINQDGDAT